MLELSEARAGGRRTQVESQVCPLGGIETEGASPLSRVFTEERGWVDERTENM